jgi:hypothetical protein
LSCCGQAILQYDDLRKRMGNLKYSTPPPLARLTDTQPLEVCATTCSGLLRSDRKVQRSVRDAADPHNPVFPGRRSTVDIFMLKILIFGAFMPNFLLSSSRDLCVLSNSVSARDWAEAAGQAGGVPAARVRAGHAHGRPATHHRDHGVRVIALHTQNLNRLVSGSIRPSASEHQIRSMFGQCGTVRTLSQPNQDNIAELEFARASLSSALGRTPCSIWCSGTAE